MEKANCRSRHTIAFKQHSFFYKEQLEAVRNSRGQPGTIKEQPGIAGCSQGQLSHLPKKKQVCSQEQPGQPGQPLTMLQTTHKIDCFSLFGIHCFIVSLFHCFTVFHCFIVSLFHCFHCFSFIVFHCLFIVCHCFIVFHCFRFIVFHCFSLFLPLTETGNNATLVLLY